MFFSTEIEFKVIFTDPNKAINMEIAFTSKSINVTIDSLATCSNELIIDLTASLAPSYFKIALYNQTLYITHPLNYLICESNKFDQF
jgi:hypothetical protein